MRVVSGLACRGQRITRKESMCKVVLTTDGLLGEFNAYYLHKAENWNPGLYEINSLQPAAGPASAATKTQVCINDTWSARVHLRAPTDGWQKAGLLNLQLGKVEQPVVAHQICWMFIRTSRVMTCRAHGCSGPSAAFVKS